MATICSTVYRVALLMLTCAVPVMPSLAYNGFDADLLSYESQRGCLEPLYNRLMNSVFVDEAHFIAGKGSEGNFARGHLAASEYNSWAKTAFEKRCYDVARIQWLEVIETFEGPEYAALRQRAQIGLDDVRAATHGSR